MDKAEQEKAENWEQILKLFEADRSRELNRVEGHLQEIKSTFEEQKRELIAQNDGLLGAIGRLHGENEAHKKRISQLEGDVQTFSAEQERMRQEFQVKAEIMRRESDLRLMDARREADAVKRDQMERKAAPKMTPKEMEDFMNDFIKGFKEPFQKKLKRGRPKGKK